MAETLRAEVAAADIGTMNCTRCDQPATVKRGDVLYCGACSLALDWQEMIHLVQDARVETPIAGRGEPIARSA